MCLWRIGASESSSYHLTLQIAEETEGMARSDHSWYRINFGKCSLSGKQDVICGNEVATYPEQRSRCELSGGVRVQALEGMPVRQGGRHVRIYGPQVHDRRGRGLAQGRNRQQRTCNARCALRMPVACLITHNHELPITPR